jgi:hypothetical protein
MLLYVACPGIHYFVSTLYQKRHKFRKKGTNLRKRGTNLEKREQILKKAEIKKEKKI